MLIRKHLIEIRDDGSFRMNMEYFNYAQGLTMTNDRFHRLFGGPPREPETHLTQRDLDLAASIQEVTEEVMLKIARNVARGDRAAQSLPGRRRRAELRRQRQDPARRAVRRHLDSAGGGGCGWVGWGGAGGVASCIGQPAVPGRARSPVDSQRGLVSRPPNTRDDEVESYLRSQSAPYTIVEDDELLPRVAQLIADGKIIGWFSGRMEFGPRALGARSIIGDARDPEMQKRMNLKIKFRESFRPFAPAVLAEHVHEWFDLDRPSPYMLLVADVKKDHQIAMTDEQQKLFGIDKLNVKRSSIPAVTHVDYSARVQTVHRETNPRFHALLSEFHRITGCPGGREHVVQRARRADRLHAGRRLSLLHEHRHRRPRPRQRAPVEGRAAEDQRSQT